MLEMLSKEEKGYNLKIRNLMFLRVKASNHVQYQRAANIILIFALMKVLNLDK